MPVLRLIVVLNLCIVTSSVFLFSTMYFICSFFTFIWRVIKRFTVLLWTKYVFTLTIYFITIPLRIDYNSTLFRPYMQYPLLLCSNRPNYCQFLYCFLPRLYTTPILQPLYQSNRNTPYSDSIVYIW